MASSYMDPVLKYGLHAELVEPIPVFQILTTLKLSWMRAFIMYRLPTYTTLVSQNYHTHLFINV